MARKKDRRMSKAETLLRRAGAVRVRRTRRGVLWRLDDEHVLISKAHHESGDWRGARNTLAKVKRMVSRGS